MGRFLDKRLAAPEVKPLLSDEHISRDGTLLQAWASHASLERIDDEDHRLRVEAPIAVLIEDDIDDTSGLLPVTLPPATVADHGQAPGPQPCC